MSNCFKVNDFDDVSSLILCCDHLCSPENPQSDRYEKLQAFRQWWQKWFAGSQTASQFTTDLYRSVIARFCGPASTVTVPCVNNAVVCIKTLEQGVVHVGYCFGNLNTLLPKQVELLERAPPRVFVAGPPGTGRSTVLYQMATKWLKDNNNVHVLSTWDCSLAASYQLYFRLQETLNPKCTDLDLTGQVKLVKSTTSARHTLSLQYKDVFILSRVDLQEDAPILKALSEAGVPVRLMSSSESDIEDVVRGISDAVWVAREKWFAV